MKQRLSIRLGLAFLGMAMFSLSGNKPEALFIGLGIILIAIAITLK